MIVDLQNPGFVVFIEEDVEAENLKRFGVHLLTFHLQEGLVRDHI